MPIVNVFRPGLYMKAVDLLLLTDYVLAAY
jgi:hypothetical protein